MKACGDRSDAKGLELSFGFVGMLQDLDPWLHKIQLGTDMAIWGPGLTWTQVLTHKSTRVAQGFGGLRFAPESQSSHAIPHQGPEQLLSQTAPFRLHTEGF